MKIVSVSLFLTSLFFSGFAQLLSTQNEYTRQDTLRGMLRPERTCFDVTFYDLDITVDPNNKSVSGSNTIHYKVEQDFTRIQIDLFEEFEVKSITQNKQPLKYTRDEKVVWIDFPQTQKKGSQGEIRIAYTGKPIVAERAPWDGGFVWSEDDNGNPWIGVACEGIGASLWWPNKDHLSDEPDSMSIRVAVPTGLMCVSNGNLRNEERLEGGFTRWDWFVANPINNYNVTVNIADYMHFGETFTNVEGEDLALDYYVLPENLETAKEHFKQVIPMMECFEKFMGPYPFYEDGFALVETPYLGMEHQSAIAYGNQYKTGYAGTDFSRIGLDFDYIIIHETGHEWWGNSVGCSDIADLWIHEGFCTYSEAIYVECMHGYETAMDYVNAKKPRVGNREPLVGDYHVNNEGSSDMYNKGMLILNTIRHIVNDDEKWWNIIRGLAKNFRHQTIHTDDVVQYINEQSGMDFTSLFDQYLHHGSLPKLEYKTKKKKDGVQVNYRLVGDVDGISAPLKATTEKETYNLITANSKWQKMKLPNVSSKDFEWGERWSYFDFVKVGRK